MFIRCNSCGERSTVPASGDGSGDMFNSNDEVGIELSAMQFISDALGSLPDDASRDRVVTWVLERFQMSAVADATPARVRMRFDAPLTGPHSDLAVDGIVDLFGATARDAGLEADEPVTAAPAPKRAPCPSDTNLDSMVQDFATDFERFAREWQHA